MQVVKSLINWFRHQPCNCRTMQNEIYLLVSFETGIHDFPYFLIGINIVYFVNVYIYQQEQKYSLLVSFSFFLYVIHKIKKLN